MPSLAWIILVAGCLICGTLSMMFGFSRTAGVMLMLAVLAALGFVLSIR